MDELKYPGMAPEQNKEEKARRRAENEARHQANLERKRRYHERREMEKAYEAAPEPQVKHPQQINIDELFANLIEKEKKRIENLDKMLESAKAKEKQDDLTSAEE